jgi:hypothetical protein
MSAPPDAIDGRLGTHWRSRAVLLLVSVALFAAGWIVARWWVSRTVVRASGEPAIVLISRPGQQSLERFDWSSGKWQQFAEISTDDFRAIQKSVQVVLNGKAVAWYQDSKFHIAPIDGSAVQISKPFEFERGDEFLGLTGDGNFALICRDGKGAVPLARGGVATTNIIIVVDLESGKIASMETWVIPHATGSSGEIYGTRLSPEVQGRWSFSRDGGWKKIADEKWRYGERQILQVVREPDGSVSWPGSPTRPIATQTNEIWSVGSVSPSGNRFVANYQGEQCALFDQASGKVTDLHLPWNACPIASFTPDDTTLVISDLLDDIHIVDTATGRVIAKDSAGSRRRALLFGIAIIGLLVGVVWLRLAFLEHSRHWATLDTLATTLSIGLALVGAATAINHPGMEWSYSDADEIVRDSSYVVMGIAAGAAVLTAWYWAHGEGSIATRWAIGVPLLAFFLLPIPMTEYWPSWWITARKLAAMLVFAAGTTAVFAWLPKTLGWTIRNRPIESPSRRFGLGAIFVVIAKTGVLLALGKWLFDVTRWWDTQSWMTAYGMGELMLVGTWLVAILFSRLSWYRIVGGLLLVGATVFILNGLGLAGLSVKYPMFLYARAAEVFTLVGMTLAVLITCLVLRSHGFRWARARASQAVP